MKIELGDILTLNNTKYMVIETSIFMENEYLFVNKLDETGEPLEEFYVFKNTENGVLLVTEKKDLDVILPIFANKLQNDINKEKYNIN